MRRRLTPACPDGLRLVRRGSGIPECIDSNGHKHLSMLRILYGASAAALDAFRAADNPVDHELVGDLERMVERTRAEIDRLAARHATPS